MSIKAAMNVHPRSKDTDDFNVSTQIGVEAALGSNGSGVMISVREPTRNSKLAFSLELSNQQARQLAIQLLQESTR